MRRLSLLVRATRGQPRAVALLPALLLGGCALLSSAGPGDVLHPASESAAASTHSTAASSGPAAIPDPAHPERHVVGEEVAVDGGTVVYLGLEHSNGQIIARFRLIDGSLDGNARFVTPDGITLAVSADADELKSAPFGDADHPPAQDATVTLVVGELLIPFEAGKLS